jgi:hypothetical protein
MRARSIYGHYSPYPGAGEPERAGKKAVRAATLVAYQK